MDFDDLKNSFASFFNFPISILHEANVRKPPRFTRQYKWSEIHCKNIQVGIYTIKTPCKSPSGKTFSDTNIRKFKIFVKIGNFKLRHMADYAMLIRKGVITRHDHTMLLSFLTWHWKTVQTTLGKRVVLINHNTDVPLLHFKYNFAD